MRPLHVIATGAIAALVITACGADRPADSSETTVAVTPAPAAPGQEGITPPAVLATQGDALVVPRATLEDVEVPSASTQQSTPTTTVAPAVTTTTVTGTEAPAPDVTEALPDLDQELGELGELDSLLEELDDLLANLDASLTETEGDIHP